jgi:patatin-related protein
MREKELRLALVCYGGISLAVYMHGITKEIWHLARASCAFHEGGRPSSDTDAVYVQLLATIEELAGLKIRVLADIVAGASAGGINGIFLSQAIATGQSLDPLTDLWLADADVDRLIDPQAKMHSRFSKIWATPLVWAFTNQQGSAWNDDLDPETRDEIHDKLTRFIRGRWFEPPFGGAVFTRLLRKAFDAMASMPVGPRLLPEEQPLDLFVTVTDFRGHPETLKLNSPPEISETEHRLTLSFRDAPGDPNTLGDPNDLIFAARATASFPGAFPPFTVSELDKVLAEDKREWPGRSSFLARSLPSREETILIDGSVLANAPFRPAISALHSRPARRDVDRRFVYIDPKPGIRSLQFNREAETRLPGFFSTIFGALSDIPREQPIRDNLEAIAGRSARIRRSRRIIEAIRPEIEEAVDQLFGHRFFLNSATAARLKKWRAIAESKAERASGPAWSAYQRLRAENVGRDMINGAAFLQEQDHAYRTRRLRFLLRQLSVLAEEDENIDYEPIRLAIFARLVKLFETKGQEQDLIAFDAATDAALAGALGQIPKPARRAPLFAYLGFPYYDVATYALLQGEELDEFDTIKVDRISPDEAQSIRKGDATATLKGIQFNSFGAFFSRAYRENDYLWGRLHGAERLIDIIISTLPDTHPIPPEKVATLKQSIFNAILDEEALRCAAITPLILQLRLEVAAMSRLD